MKTLDLLNVHCGSSIYCSVLFMHQGDPWLGVRGQGQKADEIIQKECPGRSPLVVMEYHTPEFAADCGQEVVKVVKSSVGPRETSISGSLRRDVRAALMKLIEQGAPNFAHRTRVQTKNLKDAGVTLEGFVRDKEDHWANTETYSPSESRKFLRASEAQLLSVRSALSA